LPLKRINYKSIFKLSNATICISSLFIGTLASVPKILRLHVELGELLIDISISSLFAVFVWYFNLYFLPGQNERNHSVRFLGQRLLKSLLTGAVIMLLFVLVHQLIFPQYHLASMLTMYEFRGLVINLTINLFLYLLYQSYIANRISMELEKTKVDNLDAQFELLKQQVNPHFLFNSLNTLKSMVEMNDKNSAHFIVMLSDFYRSVLEKKKSNVVTLENELETLNAYIFLLVSRFEDGFNLITDISSCVLNTVMPPFTLQLLIENCVKHNVVSFEKPLNIKIFAEDEFLVIENNFQLKLSVEHSTGTGLENIRQRYLQLSGKNILVRQTDAYFQVKLPLIYEDSYR
jgi:two-component system, LytTR family, sensor kinase